MISSMTVTTSTKTITVEVAAAAVVIVVVIAVRIIIKTITWTVKNAVSRFWNRLFVQRANSSIRTTCYILQSGFSATLTTKIPVFWRPNPSLPPSVCTHFAIVSNQLSMTPTMLTGICPKWHHRTRASLALRNCLPFNCLWKNFFDTRATKLVYGVM